jgi:photosystem II stability/assembly factor-like uncharacterized protein
MVSHPRRRRPALFIAILGLLVAACLPEPPPAAPADWERVGPAGAFNGLAASADGTLFAVAADRLYRSADGGDAWQPVLLPPRPSDLRRPTLAVDPTDSRVLYAPGAGGLFKTGDGGQNWALVLPTNFRVLAVALSPVDRDVLYVALAFNFTSFRFQRSLDGGGHWEMLQEAKGSLCGWGVYLLNTHPTDRQRLFRTLGCYAGRDAFDTLEESRDQGLAWTQRLRPELAYPVRLAGGQGTSPERLYVAANRDGRASGSTLFRSDDDGQTWRELLTFRPITTTPEPPKPNVTMGGLAYNPDQPDRVYLALAGDGQGVRASNDGGLTWSELGRSDLGRAADLLLDRRAQTLFLASESGIWRLRLATAE